MTMITRQDCQCEDGKLYQKSEIMCAYLEARPPAHLLDSVSSWYLKKERKKINENDLQLVNSEIVPARNIGKIKVDISHEVSLSSSIGDFMRNVERGGVEKSLKQKYEIIKHKRNVDSRHFAEPFQGSGDDSFLVRDDINGQESIKACMQKAVWNIWIFGSRRIPLSFTSILFSLLYLQNILDGVHD